MPKSLIPQPDPGSAALDDLRLEVRAFVRKQVDDGVFKPNVDTWLTQWNETFSRELAQRGWLGMTIPTEYGGHGRTFLERFVVTEELLAVGAPVAAHWIADRQAAPSLLKYGSQDQRQRFLPGIARGEIFWAIGMSEPESGSDLASVKTRATRAEGGWTISGTKLWTSGAHKAHAFFLLARSSALDPSDRHAGLSQFIVLLDSPGVEIRPVYTMSGDHHFNEVILDSVFVPDELVMGTIGDGWQQVTSELGFERSGPERFMSTFALLAAAVDEVAKDRLPADPGIGRLTGRMFGLHQMSTAIAGALSRGESADTAAAVVKILGTEVEGDVAELVEEITGDTQVDFTELLRSSLMQRPGFTLRGGTSEVLRGVVARGLGMR
ncbi:acyl-CoA dehydrogenase family protein [Rhodococcus sp. H29-C3]|uniref:acyl-CoA dehydrogenase family protein n=1 Tax=Rhodococcus sp. H29-C3 TaxID=3046307 RepID=UPI0024B9CB8F|nr:acyl-CoA dehydrogenase family protein [Rhodococcus sp. H29-C3]MDJ0359773.1 acyl-CoA dehydrogenase family protein [Rhodococcus sp. H29-C3]